MFQTTLTIPTRQLREFTRHMQQAGFHVLDTGARVATDDGPDGEATVRLVRAPVVQLVDPDACELGVSV